MARSRPLISVGLAVRNGEQVITRCIESILGQDVENLELIVCDNDSDDRTRELLDDAAAHDPRVRFSVNDRNVGSQQNMNRVLELARGTYFRWISADDWLEPKCLSASIDALAESEHAVGVTTYFTIHTPSGRTRTERYQGEFPTSPNAARRFERMLWFLHAGDGKYDPVYGVYRRETLASTKGFPPSVQADWLLSAELALRGPILHVPTCLAHRTRSYDVKFESVAWRQRLDNVTPESELRSSVTRLRRDLLELVSAAQLTDDQDRRCRRALRHFMLKELVRRSRYRGARSRDTVIARARAWSSARHTVTTGTG